MQIKNKKNLIHIFIFSFLFLFYGIAFGAVSNQPTLQQQVKTTFEWLIGMTALVAGIAFAVGAIQYTISGANPGGQKEAISRMLSALLGLILTLGSLVVINTINPEIKNLNDFSVLSADTGILYSDGQRSHDAPALMENADVSEIKGKGYTQIKYGCIGGKGVPLIAWFYDDIDYEGTANMQIIKCGESKDISGKSYKIIFAFPGVYLFTDRGCQNPASANLTSDTILVEPFEKNIKSIGVINGIHPEETNYTYILHDTKAIQGVTNCSPPISSKLSIGTNAGMDCTEVKTSFGVSSISVFNANPFKAGQLAPTNVQVNDLPNYTKNHVKLFSKPWGWENGALAGDNTGFNVHAETDDRTTINQYLFQWIKPNQSNFSYAGGTETTEYKNSCKTFADCPGSIQVVGKYNYKIIFYPNNNPPPTGSKCQIFSSTINSVKEKEYVASGNTMGAIMTIPLKLAGKVVSSN